MPAVRDREKIVVITGASAGIGRACAREFARHGCNVALIARGREGLQAAAQEVEAFGGSALMVVADVADGEQVERAAAQVVAQFGRIDIWVNNAFAGIFSLFTDMSPEEFRRVVDVTFMGQVNGTRAALRHMLPADTGSIVLVGSALAYRGIPLQSAYCAAKHALQGFQDSVRSELLHRKSRVRLVMVQLPGVNTPQFDWVRARVPGQPRPVGAVYQPEVAARAIRHAAHSRRKELIVGAPAWQAILADKIASPLLDRYLGATAVAGQQGPAPLPKGRPDNLFDPVAGDHGAHGGFGAKARRRSLLLWGSVHRRPLTAAAMLAAGASLLISAQRRRKS